MLRRSGLRPLSVELVELVVDVVELVDTSETITSGSDVVELTHGDDCVSELGIDDVADATGLCSRETPNIDLREYEGDIDGCIQTDSRWLWLWLWLGRLLERCGSEELKFNDSSRPSRTFEALGIDCAVLSDDVPCVPLIVSIDDAEKVDGGDDDDDDDDDGVVVVV
jgi:hypothetical protein